LKILIADFEFELELSKQVNERARFSKRALSNLILTYNEEIKEANIKKKNWSIGPTFNAIFYVELEEEL